MTYLLDTHVILWLAGDASRVPDRVQKQLEVADHRALSSASAMEIALKTRWGKLPQGQAVLDGWQHIRAEFQAHDLPLSVPHMIRAGSLDWDHGDPFDRMLVAQAMLEGLTLVTTDRRIAAYPAVTTLSW